MRARVLAAPNGELEVGGLPVVERVRRVLESQRFEPAAEGEDGEPLLLVAGDTLLDPAILRAMATSETSLEMALAIAGAEDDPAILRVPPGTPAPRDAAGLAPLAASFRARGILHSMVSEGPPPERVRDSGHARAAERTLVAGLARESDGFFARNLDRKISAPLAVWLVRRGTSPNTVTLLAALVGLAGAGLLATAGRVWQTLGALLFVASTVLDGCDGEVARLALRETRLGHALDLVCDNLVNGAVFLGVGLACLRADETGRLGMVVTAGLAGLGFATAAGFAYSAWLARSAGLDSLREAYERLASRDFAYLLPALAACGRLVWFVWAAALGTWAFGLVLIGLRLAGWPPALDRIASPATPGEEAMP